MPSKRFTFSKIRRLNRPSEFERVRKNGRQQRGHFLVLSVLMDDEIGAFRAGFITSGKVGSAVVRNRVRRRLRDVVRKHQHGIRDRIWVVTIARASAATADHSQLEAEWLRLAARASILATRC